MATKDKTPLNARLDLFQFDLGKNKELTTTFSTLYAEKEGDWTAIKADLTEDKGFTPDVVKNLTFTHALSDWSKDNADLVKVFQKDKTTFSMRDIALNFDKAQFTEKLIQEQVAPADADIVAEHYAASLHDALFHIEPTAVVQNLVQNQKQTPISDPILRGGIATFLNNQEESFNIKTTSIYTAFKQENAFKDIPAEQQEGIKTALKTVQRVAAISPVAEAIPVLMKAKIHTAYQVSEMPESQFITAFKDALGDNGAAIAQQLHVNAVNSRIRNEHALIALKEAKQGTGIAFIDKSLNVEAAVPTEMSTRGIGDDKNNLSWDTLFGDADLCECGECTSVYSAASYFVELMQYLRNNNLDPNPTNDGSIKIKADAKDISGTPLQKLLDRRPDLGCLQLTCANTNTILPYVDLVNEVMEHYVAYPQTKLKAFNVDDETSGELLAQPQHTEYQAYCILKDEVYPFTLPYHQPIDAARIYLDSLGTSRHELMDTFRSPRKITTQPDPIDNCDTDNLDAELDNIPADANKTLDKLHDNYLNRAVDAEYLGMTQEEYVILTKEAFVSKEYWDMQCSLTHTQEEYLLKIGEKPVHKYYGYDTEGVMLDMTTEKGLTYVKKQFLPRTGIQYTDLVELLKTQCLNPNMPRGKAMSITESLHFSYRFLQNFKKEKGEDELIKLLTNSEKLIELLPYLKDNATFFNLEGKKSELACPPTIEEGDKISEIDIKNWVKCHFNNIGKMIVLENGRECGNGRIDLKLKDNQFPLYHYEISDCQIWLYSNFLDVQSSQKVEGTLVGTIDKDTGLITAQDVTMLNSFVNDGTFISEKGEKGVFFRLNENKVYLLAPQKDTCNLDTVRLVHLDGTPLNVKGYEYEYDHIHRFIRLWRKMGWTIDEVNPSSLWVRQKVIA